MRQTDRQASESISQGRSDGGYIRFLGCTGLWIVSALVSPCLPGHRPKSCHYCLSMRLVLLTVGWLTLLLVFTLIRVSAYLMFPVKDMFCAYLCLCLSQFKFQYRFQSIINIISEITHQQLNFLISERTKQTSVLLKPTSIAEVSCAPLC